MTSGTILVIGATAGVGRHVVRCAVEAGLHPRTLVRKTERAARSLPAETELVAGEARMPVDMARALEGVDGVILGLGSHGAPGEAEAVDHGIVRVLVECLLASGHPVRVGPRSRARSGAGPRA
ncbi:NAD(P)H-binding protein [Brachybacterium sp. GPGPB12]|uniref:NAD(P)H-binding protein n=1 Tax=Brachybacterium sp. GPGPB12 TaxID=3023517 RepID=UPI0031344385